MDKSNVVFAALGGLVLALALVSKRMQASPFPPTLFTLALGIDFRLAALIGALLSPTDPVAAAPIVSGPLAEKCIPERVRNAISFESGANDGLGYPFVLLAFLLLALAPSMAIQRWLLDVVL